MTYIRNLWAALLNRPIIKTEVRVEKVLMKDLNGLFKRDLEIIKKFAHKKPYQVGDPLELVAYKAGMQDLINMIETKMVIPKTRKLL